MKRLRFDVATDPYIVKLRKRVTHLENTGRLTEGWPRYGWEFEAKRRFFADAIPYYEDEATWGWHAEMLEELAAVPTHGSTEHCQLDPDGPGYGVHVFEEIAPLIQMVNGTETDPSQLQGSTRRLLAGSVLMCDQTGAQGVLAVVRVPKQGDVTAMRANLGRIDGGSPVTTGYVDLPPHPTLTAWARKMQALLKAKVLDVEPKKATVRDRAHRRGGRTVIDTPVNLVVWRKRIVRRREEALAEAMERKVGKGYRYWCSAHTRAQWFPSVGEHREIVIREHLRGEPGAPVRPKVNLVAR